jgi:hypothetical protein
MLDPTIELGEVYETSRNVLDVLLENTSPRHVTVHESYPGMQSGHNSTTSHQFTKGDNRISHIG